MNINDSKVKNLVDWLRDAHAMEQQAETMLKAQSERLEHYPELRARIEEHITETQGQRELIEQCLARYDASPSGIKDFGGKMMAFAQGVGGSIMTDEVVKGAAMGYVFENLEIASYTVLIAAAKEVGDTETQRACETIIEQEIAMAQWLKDHLPQVVSAFLTRDAAPDAVAKR
ncbi:ferritin-like domain-containing protein [Halopseudomonas nanhaiensis]|uniref:ferritin-like domain-containing protein n=1 Tax=Halopseudomonas nanhaiensis TaxID=2830842 RepID=UPI001CC16687|nr:ferritin-like domain-containing protein [Halopseudomonas nanhaiensis]UAW97510.1 ferritin-like domain-containing protein [Halopseudomonas nanhaiensis]